MTNLRQIAKKLPVVGPAAVSLQARIDRKIFHGSARYWEQRYQAGGNSGDGSYGVLAAFKAHFLNHIVRANAITSVMEFGCGDGAQLELAEYPSYLGVDVSSTIIDSCRATFQDDLTKTFLLYPSEFEAAAPPPAELSLSLDVIYHLVEDDVFERHMRDLFDHATRMVIIYASNTDARTDSAHVRHRKFTTWTEANAPEWQLTKHVPNNYGTTVAPPGHPYSFADFFVFEKL